MQAALFSVQCGCRVPWLLLGDREPDVGVPASSPRAGRAVVLHVHLGSVACSSPMEAVSSFLSDGGRVSLKPTHHDKVSFAAWRKERSSLLKVVSVEEQTRESDVDSAVSFHVASFVCLEENVQLAALLVLVCTVRLTAAAT